MKKARTGPIHWNGACRYAALQVPAAQISLRCQCALAVRQKFNVQRCNYRLLRAKKSLKRLSETRGRDVPGRQLGRRDAVPAFVSSDACASRVKPGTWVAIRSGGQMASATPAGSQHNPGLTTSARLAANAQCCASRERCSTIRQLSRNGSSRCRIPEKRAGSKANEQGDDSQARGRTIARRSRVERSAGRIWGAWGGPFGQHRASQPRRRAPRAAPKTVSQILGEITWLMTQSPRHKAIPLGDLEWLLMPAILLRQFRIFYKGEQPVGVAVWALADDLVAKRIDAGDNRLTAVEWKSGTNMHIIDLSRRLAERQRCGSRLRIRRDLVAVFEIKNADPRSDRSGQEDDIVATTRRLAFFAICLFGMLVIDNSILLGLWVRVSQRISPFDRCPRVPRYPLVLLITGIRRRPSDILSLLPYWPGYSQLRYRDSLTDDAALSHRHRYFRICGSLQPTTQTSASVCEDALRLDFQPKEELVSKIASSIANARRASPAGHMTEAGNLLRETLKHIYDAASAMHTLVSVEPSDLESMSATSFVEWFEGERANERAVLTPVTYCEVRRREAECPAIEWGDALFPYYSASDRIGRHAPRSITEVWRPILCGSSWRRLPPRKLTAAIGRYRKILRSRKLIFNRSRRSVCCAH